MNKGAEAANASDPQCLALIKVKVNVLNYIFNYIFTSTYSVTAINSDFYDQLIYCFFFYNSVITLSVYKMLSERLFLCGTNISSTKIFSLLSHEAIKFLKGLLENPEPEAFCLKKFDLKLNSLGSSIIQLID